MLPVDNCLEKAYANYKAISSSKWGIKKNHNKLFIKRGIAYNIKSWIYKGLRIHSHSEVLHFLYTYIWMKNENSLYL